MCFLEVLCPGKWRGVRVGGGEGCGWVIALSGSPPSGIGGMRYPVYKKELYSMGRSREVYLSGKGRDGDKVVMGYCGYKGGVGVSIRWYLLGVG